MVEEKKRKSVAVVWGAIFLPGALFFVRHGVPLLQGGRENILPELEEAFEGWGAHVGLPSANQS